MVGHRALIFGVLEGVEDCVGLPSLRSIGDHPQACGAFSEAGIVDGSHKSPKGLRHGFGINATVAGVPLNMLCKWMGHADIATTAVYADAMGQEEQDIASRMWV